MRAAVERQPSKESPSAPLSTSLVPVTTLQQYSAEPPLPYLSARKSYASSRVSAHAGSRDAAMKPSCQSGSPSPSLPEYLHIGRRSYGP